MPTALFCTSPVGGGHVLRDLAIGRQLQELLPQMEVVYVAGGPSAQMLLERGERVEAVLRPNCYHVREGRLQLAAFYLDFLLTDLVHAWQISLLIRKHKPALLCLDEMYTAVYLGKLLGLPTILMGDMAGGPHHRLLERPLACLLSRLLTYLAGGAMLLADLNLLIGSLDHLPRHHLPFAQERMIPVGPISQLSLTPPFPREEARRRLGYGQEKVVTVSVGGSEAGPDILRAAAQAFDLLRLQESSARMVLVCGPGISPRSLGIKPTPGLEVHGHVLDLVARLCASDAALVQAGLTTLTEAMACGVPLVVVPIEGLWEQEANALWAAEEAGAQVVRRAQMTPESLAQAIARAWSQPPRPPEPLQEGAHRAALLIAHRLAELDPGSAPPL